MPCYDPRDHIRTVYEKSFDPHYKQECDRLHGEPW